ncbi:MAG: hypothetical protein RI907_351 [Pseudomonadota bacterium]|jgi:AcrR family transcriptional regulator
MQRMSESQDEAKQADAPAAAPSAIRVQLTPQDWIDAALAHLVDHNIDAVRVDVLARKMGVTRGSFYWHFTDRDDLLKRVLQHWRTTTTEAVIARFQGRDPVTVVRELLALPAHGRTAAQASSVEQAVREWARRDPTAREMLDEVDNRRLTYFAECFTALGHDAAEARLRAFMLYGSMISDSLLGSPGNEGDRQARMTRVHDLLTTPPAPTPA